MSVSPPRAVVLLDGASALVGRPSPHDSDGLDAFFAALRAASADQRDRVPVWARAEHMRAACTGSGEKTVHTRIAWQGRGDTRTILAAGSWIEADPGSAELALAVHPDHRGRGLARILLARLARDAASHGFRRLTAVTHREDPALLRFLRESGYAIEAKADEDDVRVALDVVPDVAGRMAADLCSQIATTASLVPLMQPKSIAVVGASRDRGSLGYRVLSALVEHGFQGPVYAINPKASVVGSFPTHASLKDVPEAVDLAVILVPAAHVEQVVADAAACGVRGLVVITAGFAEVGDMGRARQERLVRFVRESGMRLIGPNCMGVVNTAPTVSMNASFSPCFPPHGRVAMLSQSGALGMAILAFTQSLGLGLSSFVSIGNKADVSSNDLLEYWESDSATDVILLYLESFGNPRRFSRIARRVGRTKPIIAVKGGRSAAGKRAAGSHTAALVGADVAVDALFEQAGVIRAGTLEEMFHLALLLSSQPLPDGPRVGVITNAGGPAILAADALASRGLEVPELSDALQAELAAFLPSEASTKNPVDMIASASPEAFRRAAELLMASDEVDALMVIDVPLDASGWPAIESELLAGIDAGAAYAAVPKPVVAYVMGAGIESQPRLLAERIPAFPFPEAAAKALGAAAAYAKWRHGAPSVEPVPRLHDMQDARAWCDRWRAKYGTGWLGLDEAMTLLARAGLPIAPGCRATSAEEAVRAADALHGPVAMKVISPAALHKSDRGGVRLGLADAVAVEAAYVAIRDAFPDQQGVWMQPMMRGVLETLVGVTEDPVFGPLIAFGLGGTAVEALGDVAFRITPLSARDAGTMLEDLRARSLLEGYRGQPAVDRDALRDTILAVSRLVEAVPFIDEMDLNPVLALPDDEGCVILDARIHLGAGKA